MQSMQRPSLEICRSSPKAMDKDFWQFQTNPPKKAFISAAKQHDTPGVQTILQHDEGQQHDHSAHVAVYQLDIWAVLFVLHNVTDNPKTVVLNQGVKKL